MGIYPALLEWMARQPNFGLATKMCSSQKAKKSPGTQEVEIFELTLEGERKPRRCNDGALQHDEEVLKGVATPEGAIVYHFNHLQ